MFVECDVIIMWYEGVESKNGAEMMAKPTVVADVEEQPQDTSDKR